MQSGLATVKFRPKKNAAVMHNSTFINISKQRIKSYQTEAAWH